MSWPAEALTRIDATHELEIRPPGGRWTTIWVVTAGGQAYVRTWHRRDTGWYGRALRAQHAQVRAPGVEAEVVVQDVGDDPGLREPVDAAFRDKYGDGGAASMITDAAASSTLRLDLA